MSKDQERITSLLQNTLPANMGPTEKVRMMYPFGRLSSAIPTSYSFTPGRICLTTARFIFDLTSDPLTIPLTKILLASTSQWGNQIILSLEFTDKNDRIIKESFQPLIVLNRHKVRVPGGINECAKAVRVVESFARLMSLRPQVTFPIPPVRYSRQEVSESQKKAILGILKTRKERDTPLNLFSVGEILDLDLVQVRTILFELIADNKVIGRFEGDSFVPDDLNPSRSISSRMAGVAFFCQVDNQTHPATDVAFQCSQCGRFICEMCFLDLVQIGHPSCPMCDGPMSLAVEQETHEISSKTPKEDD